MRRTPTPFTPQTVEIDLSSLRPLAACPHSPDNVKAVEELGSIPVDQCCIGSCTNSSLMDMLKVAAILKGKTVHPNVSLSIAPGSKQVYNMLAENGALADLIAAGARILECALRPPASAWASPPIPAAYPCVLSTATLKDAPAPRMARSTWSARDGGGLRADWRVHRSPHPGRTAVITLPDTFLINDNMIIPPADEKDMDQVEILRGPNLQSPSRKPRLCRTASRPRPCSR